jgi:DNA-binding response OmpR family regulator
VLLVDDDEVNLLLTSAALRQRGFDITEAARGEDALARLARWTPEIVVLDAQMPGLDGFEACALLRGMPGLANVPVLMLTGLDDDASVARAYRAGATDFFVKSSQWSLLAERLNFLLRSSRTYVELERSKARLARAQDLARMGSFDWRRRDGTLAMQPEAQRVFGLPAGSARASLHRLLRMVPPDERPAFVRMLRERLHASAPIACDVTIDQYDGHRRVIHVEAEPEFGEQGHSKG